MNGITCSSDKKTATSCQMQDNIYKFVTEACVFGQECSPGKGCVSICDAASAGFEEHCEGSKKLVYCNVENKTIESRECLYNEICDPDKTKCSPKTGMLCDESFPRECYVSEGKQILELCKDGKIDYQIADVDEFCGKINGIVDIYETCTSNQFRCKQSEPIGGVKSFV